MKIVSEKFLTDLYKTKSPAIFCDIYLTNEDDEIKDITPFLCRNSLNSINNQIENKLTDFQAGNGAFSIWYDEEIWEWIQESEEIKVEIWKGFSYEKLNVFNGFLDKFNCEHHTRGILDLRAIPPHTYYKKYKINGVSRPVLNPCLAKDAIKAIFDHIEIDEQNIRIVPIDTIDNRYIDNYFEAINNVGSYHSCICPIDDYSFFLCTDLEGIVKVTFNDDWTDFTTVTVYTPTSYLWQPLRFEKWRDDVYVVVFGTPQVAIFYNTPLNVEDTDMVAQKLVFFDSDGNILHEVTPGGFTQDGKTYYPRARDIQPVFDERTGKDYFFIGYNGSSGASAYALVKHYAYKVFQINNPTTLVKTKTFDNMFAHPSCWGIGAGYGSYFAFCTVSSFSVNVRITIVNVLDWSQRAVYTGESGDYFAGGSWSVGKYLIFGKHETAYDCINLGITEDILPEGFIDVIASSYTNRQEPRQVLTGYKKSTAKMVMYYYSNDEYTLVTPSETLRDIVYKDKDEVEVNWDKTIDEGFKYWHTYNSALGNKLEFLYLPRLYQIYGSGGYAGIWNSRMMPFMPLWDSDATTDILTVLENIAKAFNCIFNFASFDSAFFLSRGFVGDEFTITKNIAYKFQDISKDDPYQIKVQYDSEEYIYGAESKELVIASPYIPNHGIAVQTIAKNYYDFFATYRYLITLNTDFLIFLELYDFVNIWYQYQGYIMNLIHELSKVNLNIRGKKYESISAVSV